MSWVTKTLTSSIGQKLVMSLSGLFLVIFLVTHLAGNISLLSADGRAFNEYAHFMKHTKVIVIGEVVMFAFILLHIVQAVALSKKNNAARSQKYAVPHKNEKVSWTSKYMMHFGIVILAFLVLHLVDFFSYKYFREASLNGIDFSNLGYLELKDAFYKNADKVYLPNLHAKVHEVYVNSPIHWIIYPAAMAVIGFHLNHGFQSAFRTLGFKHQKYMPIIQKTGLAYAIIIPLAFALIPVFIKFGLTFG